MLDALATIGALATFFVLVEKAEAAPELVHDALRAGHAVGLHGLGHHRHDRRPEADLVDDLGEAKARLEAVTGSSVGLYRPPYGRLSYSTLRAADRLGLRTALWSADPADWRDDVDEGMPPLNHRVAGAIGAGEVVLLHDGASTFPGQGRRTAEALRSLPSGGRAGSPRFTTMEDT